MKKPTKSIITSSLLAVAFGALSVGSTFALFTSQSKTEINVESGIVNVESKATLVNYSSSVDGTVHNFNGTETSYTNTLVGNSFSINGENSIVTIDKMVPGDSLTISLSALNKSNVKTKTRLAVEHSKVGTQKDLFPALKFTFNAGTIAPADLFRWKSNDAVTDSEGVDLYGEAGILVTIAFPDGDNGEILFGDANHDNQYQDAACSIAFSIQAVQGNAATSPIDEINAYLSSEMLFEGQNKTMHDAVVDMAEIEYDDLAVLNGYVYDLANDRFVKESSVTANKVDYFKVCSSMPNPQDFSIYAVGNGWTTVEGLTVGFDAGDLDSIVSIEYNRHNATVGQEVTIRTNGGTLTVDAPLDTIHHYGDAQMVTLTAVGNSSYYENGTVSLVDVKKGRLVITNEKEASVGTIYLSATNDAYDGIILATQSNAELPDVVARESVTRPESGEKLVVTIQQVDSNGTADPAQTEKIYLYPERDVKEEEKGYDVSDLGLLVVEAISTEGQAQAEKQLADKAPEVVDTVKETNVENKQEVISEATAVNGGKGTKTEPYLIATGNQWYNFIKKYNDQYIGSWNGNGWDDMYVSIIGDLDMTGYDLTDFVTYPNNLKLNGNEHKFVNLTSSIWGYYGDYYGHCEINDLAFEDCYAKYSLIGYGPADATSAVDVNRVTANRCESNGGLFMYYTGSSIVNFNYCVVENSLVHGPNNMAGGGYVGNGQGITIDHCKFGGSVIAESANMVAGFVGQGIATIRNSEITAGSIIRSIAANGKVAVYDGQGGGAGENDNNVFNGILSCDKEANAKKQGTSAAWEQYVSLQVADFNLADDGTITFVGENRNFDRVTISEYIFQRSEYYKDGSSGHSGKNAYILGGYSCYWEDLIQADVDSDVLYKVDRVTNIVNVLSEDYADKVACSTTEEPNVEWTRYGSYLDRETGVLYYDGRSTNENRCSFIGETGQVTNAETGELTPVENPFGDFYIVIKGYDQFGIVGSVTLSYRVYFGQA